MKDSEIRLFEIKDRSPFPKCTVRPKNPVLKIQIRKYKRPAKFTQQKITERGCRTLEVPEGAVRFKTIQFYKHKTKYPMGSGCVDCHPGLIGRVNVDRELQGCGVGAILIKLCMNEKKRHKTKSIKKNIASSLVQEIKTNIALKSLVQYSFRNTKNWLESTCSKLVMLAMTNETPNVPSIFFESAKLFGFSIVVIKVKTPHTGYEYLYPKAGPCNIHELATNYRNGSMTIDGPSVKVIGEQMKWYFCRPTIKAAERIPKCTGHNPP